MSATPVDSSQWASLRADARRAFPKQLVGQNTEDVLLPYQKEVVQAIDENEVVVVEKSRRTGITWGMGSAAVLHAGASRSAGGMDAMYIGYSLDMTREFIDVCAMWAKAFSQVASEVEEYIFKDRDKDGERNIQAFRITFASGFEILALSSRPRSLRGKQGLVIIDEAAFHDDFPGLMKAALALLMWGGKVAVISTHLGVENPFNETIKEIKEGKKPYTLITITFDRALEEGLFRRIRLVQGKTWTSAAEAEWRAKIVAFYGDDADEELFCIPSQSSGVFLPSSVIESCMSDAVPVLRWISPANDFVDWSEERAERHTREWLDNYIKPLLALLPQECNHYLGGDFGRTGDLSAFWPGTETLDLRLAVPFAVELRNCPHRTQKQILFFIIAGLPKFSGTALDARGNGSYLAEAARQEYGPEYVLEAMITESWYRAVMPKVKSRLEDKTAVLPQDAFVLADFRALKVVKGVARIPDKRNTDASGKRHGDAAIAFGMLVHAREELDAAEPWAMETAGERASVRLLQGF